MTNPTPEREQETPAYLYDPHAAIVHAQECLDYVRGHLPHGVPDVPREIHDRLFQLKGALKVAGVGILRERTALAPQAEGPESPKFARGPVLTDASTDEEIVAYLNDVADSCEGEPTNYAWNFQQAAARIEALRAIVNVERQAHSIPREEGVDAKHLARMMRNAAALLPLIPPDVEPEDLQVAAALEKELMVEAEKLYPVEQSLADQGFPSKINGTWPPK